MIAVIILVRIYRLGGGQPLSLLIPSVPLGLRQVPADAPAQLQIADKALLYAKGACRIPKSYSAAPYLLFLPL